MTSLNTVRHTAVFNAEQFNNRGNKVDIIGCGATGSHVAYMLGKYGIDHIRLWDDDVFESHNVSNQLVPWDLDEISESLHYYREPSLDAKHKDGVAKTLLSIFSNTEQAEARHEKYIGQEPLYEWVFLLTDTMASRKAIFAKAIKYKPQIKGMIETRLDPFGGRVYTINPMNPAHVKAWEGWTDYDDVKADPSSCGGTTTLISSACLVAALAVNQFIRMYGGQRVENEILLGLADVYVETTTK